ncbi:MAG: 3-deoxy-D-manno-octulosonic acid transferase [bacterium]|nr:3-deoxy-D-manno-octulosonic acid transferase [bacterium]
MYQILIALGMLLAAPMLLIFRGRHYLPTLPGRLGRHRGPGLEGALWIHAVSVGEVGVAATLARSLPASLPLLITTITPTGQRRAREAFAERRAVVTYLPFDFAFAVRRFFARYRPAALVLVEGDYWPMVLRFAARREIPVAVVNGRVGRRSYGRLRRLRRWTRPLFFSAVDRFGMQTRDDRQRLIDLGVAPERIEVTGNLKYDSPEPPELPELAAEIRRLAAGRPILIAGSTMRGEDELVLDAFRQIGAGKRALLLMVPRHPERWDQVERLVRERGLGCVRRSSLPGAGEAGDVLLLDSLGELAALYRLAAIAFIGGTLVPTGGHNPLEPARFAVPIVVGRSMENFAEMAEQFDAAGAWRMVDDPQGLAEVWEQWLERGDEAREVGRRGAELLAANRGALERTVTLLEPLLRAARQEKEDRIP